MSEKDLSEFQQGGPEADKEDEQVEQRQDCPKKVKVNFPGKPRKSCSFVRNWGGWLKGDE